ncbi:S-layer homology domain-containing protein [Psychrobacillus sp. NPDC096623]|uniref:S-layer homology domain-containing protein n=1 Tax=Psychrobacillus sp. NPDC096623 TaxID=3364492 RepID=UPI003809007D
MAYQPKSYKKFVATAATATLVATAVVPGASAAVKFEDVSSTYKTAVDYLISKNITEGISDTKFGTDAPIKRGDAAIFIAKALGLDTKSAPDQDFTDVNSRVEGAVNAIVNAKIASGKTESKFAPDDYITRQEMAKILVNAYKLEAGDTKNSFTDVNSNWDAYVDALVENGVTLGKTEKTFAATDTVKRGEFALFIHRAEHIVPATPSVVSVSATNPSTLTLTGEGLQNLKAEQVSVVGNKVTALTASKDGKTATLTLEGKLAPNSEVALSVTVDDVKKDFTAKFEFKVTSVDIAAQQFDDERAGQKVSFSVNGQPADVDYLALAGYTVTYVAKTSTGAAANGFFDNAVGVNTSSTGIISNPALAKGSYTVEVQVTKSGEALVTDSAAVKIVNIDAETTALDTVSFYNFADTATDDSSAAYDAALLGDDYKMNSTTLVAGEKAKLLKVTGTVAGEKVTLPETNVDVKSSNEAVVSVDANGVLTAESAGTATITLKVGNVTKTVNFTVTNTTRKLTKVTPATSSVKAVVGYNTTIGVKTLDQYGDPFAVVTGDATPGVYIEEVIPKVGGVEIVSDFEVVTDAPGSIGSQTITLTGAVAGKGTVSFKNPAGTVIGSFILDVSAVDNTGSKKLEIISAAPDSTDNTLDILADDTVSYELARYNTQGTYVEAVDLATYTVEVVDGTVATATFVGGTGNATAGLAKNETASGTAGDVSIDIKGLKAGKTDILLKDTASGKVDKFTITVVNNPIEIKSVNFLATPTVNYVGALTNYEDVLNITSSNADDIVNGVALTQNSLHKVRISETAGTEGVLYLDVDADGTYTSGTDTDLGLLTLTATASSTFAPITTDSVAGYTTVAAGEKGTLLFKVLTDVSGVDVTTSIAATSVSVDVK